MAPIRTPIHRQPSQRATKPPAQEGMTNLCVLPRESQIEEEHTSRPQELKLNLGLGERVNNIYIYNNNINHFTKRRIYMDYIELVVC